MNTTLSSANRKISTPQINLPKGGGAIRGLGETFQANQFTGAAGLSIPIPVSPCRGFEPALSLEYSSAAGNGIFGMGFGLSIPGILRKTSRAIPRYDDSDTFLLSGADDLVPVDGSQRDEHIGPLAYSVLTYRPRTAGSFDRIERWTSLSDGDVHWRVTTAGNITSVYGMHPGARIADPAENTRIFQWLIEQTYDARGNQVVYAYQAGEDNTYLRKIKYGNYQADTQPDSDDWHFEIDFAYSTPPTVENPPAEANAGADRPRPDPFSSYKSGFRIRTSLRCIQIAVSHRFAEASGGSIFVASATRFDYLDSAGSSRLSLLWSVTQVGYQDGVAKEMPPLEFGWSKFLPENSPGPGPAAGLEFKALVVNQDSSFPGYIDTGAYQMVDLYGEGIPGILYSDASQVLYARPLGDGRCAAFGMPQVFPLDRDLQAGQNALIDVEGDGKLDLVVITPSRAGYYPPGETGGWEPYRAFESIPGELFHPQKQMVDVTGDGLPDLLLFDEGEVKVYPSLGKPGYGRLIQQPAQPALPVTSSPSAREAVHFADIFGDGGSHLVRVRSGSVECWPNLGYGRFGPKVELDNAPLFGGEMDASRVFLTDVDGSGTADLVYAYPDHVDIYLNESGNRFSDPLAVPLPRGWNDASQIDFADVLGNGAACLVFTSLNEDLRLEHVYVDFTGGVKPYLLISADNNMGASTLVAYSASTRFYLDDEQAGVPWITHLPFPVQVVAKIETRDLISDTSLVTHYTYHHGYYDPIDHEFRGFGRVERQDAESFDDAAGEAQAAAFHVPPVTIKTWHHTGAFMESGGLSRQYAKEYYQGDAQARPLPGSVLAADFQDKNPESASEAYRALYGRILREEVYGPSEDPYLVTESNYFIRLDQPKGDHPYAVCFVQPRETISYHYERIPADPRIEHSLTLEVDAYGNVLRSLDIGYSRRPSAVDAALTAEDRTRQAALLISYTENVFTNPVLEQAYHAPLLAETRTFELTGCQPADAGGRFRFEEWAQNDFAPLATLVEIPYEQAADNTTRQKRLIKEVRTLYRPDDLGTAPQNDPLALLPLGKLEALALAGTTFELAFTPGLLQQVYQRWQADGSLENLLPDPAAVLAVDAEGGQSADRGGYISGQALQKNALFPAADEADVWWSPSGQAFLSPNSGDPAARELDYARQHFFQPQRIRDAFYTGAVPTECFVAYDAYDLMVEECRDALGNTITAKNDYRVLKPWLVTDPNGNRAAAAFDALGMVAATALMGKEEESDGDLLEGFTADLPLASLQAFASDPQAQAAALLGKATTRFVYDLDRYRRAGQPPFAALLAREIHVSDLPADQVAPIQISFTYSDGFGRVAQLKGQVEAGDAPARAANAPLPGGDVAPGALVLEGGAPVNQPMQSPRWVSTGRTVYNNKGQPVKQYEPFFSVTHLYEPEREVTESGVSAVLLYDPAGRMAAALHPDHSYEKVVFEPWGQVVWDVNDTVLLDPAKDEDVAAFFRLLPPGEYQPSWYNQRIQGQKGEEEKSAADKAAAHAGTPTMHAFDALGRAILTIADNGKDPAGNPQTYRTEVILDITGSPLRLIDALGRTAERYDYDLPGSRIHEASMDAGERWLLRDATGHLLTWWDSKGRQFRHTYDPLRRPEDFLMREDPQAEILLGRTVYGETQENAEDDNLRGRTALIFDQAGVVTNNAYDFKGNLLSSQRQFASVYWEPFDWSAGQGPALDAAEYAGDTLYDALNRPARIILPHDRQDAGGVNVIQPVYNEANMLRQVHVWLRQENEPTGLLDPASADVHAITNIDYDANGRRTLTEYGNDVQTSCAYDPLTFRLARLQTSRGQAALQDLNYTYDPLGNVTHIRDDAQQAIFFNGQVVFPECDYTCDAVYRLTQATGREHIGQVAQPQASWDDAFRVRLPQPGDGQAMRNYTEQYQYDAADNLKILIHQAANGSWTRAFSYMEPSLIEPAKHNNRLSGTAIGAATETYAYDAHGNLARMPHLTRMDWDWSDRLQVTARQAVANGTPEQTWYVYNEVGQRVRKVTVSNAAEGKTPVRKNERLYLGSIEIYREFGVGGETVDLERETLCVMDDQQLVALVETRTQGEDKGPEQIIRYQLGNHLGSVALELDDKAQIISYEEYTPFGSTSYQAVRSQTETPKRYRYSGKERDDATGLYYYGARYYAPWLARWTSADPAGTVDGLNRYAFVGENPATHVDIGGMGKTPGTGGKKGKAPKKPTLKMKSSAGKKSSGDKIARKNFDTGAKRLARITAGVALTANLTVLDKAQPHRVPFTNLRDRVLEFTHFTADETELRRWTDRFTVKEAKLEQLEEDTNLDPHAALVKKLTVLQYVQQAEERIQTEREALIHLKQSGATTAEMHDQAQKLITALNTYPLNIPDLGPHSDTNAAVQDHLHLNVTDSGSLTPASKMAGSMTPGKVSEVAVDASGKHLVLTTGELFLLSSLDPADRMMLDEHGYHPIQSITTKTHDIRM
jgi:RHS repeat-associated protein